MAKAIQSVKKFLGTEPEEESDEPTNTRPFKKVSRK
jgi:hypothetical protein